MNLTAFGYSAKTINEHGLHVLSEVTLSATPSELRRIAAFLVASADGMEKHGPTFGHSHLQDEEDLRQSWSDSATDVIVVSADLKEDREIT